MSKRTLIKNQFRSKIAAVTMSENFNLDKRQINICPSFLLARLSSSKNSRVYLKNSYSTIVMNMYVHLSQSLESKTPLFTSLTSKRSFILGRPKIVYSFSFSSVSIIYKKSMMAVKLSIIYQFQIQEDGPWKINIPILSLYLKRRVLASPTELLAHFCCWL